MAELNFKKGLYKISSHFSRSEVDKMKFILSDFIPRRKLERATSAFHVFCLLESHHDSNHKAFLSPSSLDFFKEVLSEVHKAHYIDRYLSSGTTDLRRTSKDPFLSEARLTSFLASLADELTADNVRDTGLFFSGETLRLEDVESIREGVKLFERLKDASVSVDQLRDVLDVLSRKDLVRKIDVFLVNSDQSSLSRRLNSSGQSTSSRGRQEEGSSMDPESCTTGSTSFTSLGESSMVLSPTDQPMTTLETDTGGRGMAVMALQGREKELSTKQLSVEVEKRDKKITELNAEVGDIKQKQSDTSDAQRVRELEQQLRLKIEEVNSQRKETEVLRNALLSRDDAPVYPMKCQPHGLAVIFVNGKFDNNPLDPGLRLKNRAGAGKDEDLFVTTFTHLGYTTNVYRNYTSIEILAVMDEVNRLDHRLYDSLVVCVSSHGNERAIYGSDSVEVSREQFYNSVRSCETLKDKPKLFFLQACRIPVVTADSPENNQPGEAPPTALHPDADMLIANASSATNAAYITPQRGSWFAESLKNKLTDPQLRFSRSLLQLLQEVNHEVCDKVGQTVLGGSVNQCVEVTTRLRKGVRFFDTN